MSRRIQPSGALSDSCLSSACCPLTEAKPRNLSTADYHEKDEFNVADFIEGLRFVRGELHFDADYIRGRRIKTRIAVRANGTVMLETIGRGKAVLRWLERYARQEASPIGR